MIILDTDVLSEAMRANPTVLAWLNTQPKPSIWTTAITVFEIRLGLSIMPVGRRRTLQESAFARAIADKLEGRVLAFDRAAAEETAALAHRRYSAGRTKEDRDTMIAGIALAQRATLATRNVRHFDDLSVRVVNPWEH
jgi:toxin FitB